MAPFYPVYVSRSDGKLEIVSKKERELNQPTEEQLDDSPNAEGICDYYKQLKEDESKDIDWRRKLGEMLMRQIGTKEQAGKNYILATFPENFRLYEHLKHAATETSTSGKHEKPARNHAKGPNDRQDAYLYGHPLGRKKRYRSPSDFFPHLLWLASDATGDPGNCSCKICSPEEFQGSEKSMSDVGSVEKSEPMKKEEPTRASASAAPSASAGSSGNAGKSMRRKLSQDSSRQSTKPSVSSTPLTSGRPAANLPHAMLPTPLPPARCREQELDSQYNQFLFRLGELVWFNRGGAWGLSVIVMRGHYQDRRQQNRARYLVQPLSHPYGHPEPKIMPDEALLRPWLAWSAPGPTHARLAGGGLTYETVDWAAVVQGQLGQGDAEVDGSILAARSIDDSYTLFDQIDTPTAAAGETYWNGIYLGAEKVWVGEPVRLRIGSGMDVMVLHDIIERTRSGFVSSSGSKSSTTVVLIGDIYTFATVPPNKDNPALLPPENPHLPRRLRMDLQFRNGATAPIHGTASYWKLMQPMARLNLQDVKGRWYESSLLLPILRGQEAFSHDLARGQINDTGAWMNGRCDASASSSSGTTTGAPEKVGTRRMTRLHAFGRAVRAGTQISRGLDGSPDESRFPATMETEGTMMDPIALGDDEGAHPAASTVGGGGGSGQTHGYATSGPHQQTLNIGESGGDDIDQFMDLEGIDHDGLLNQFTSVGGGGADTQQQQQRRQFYNDDDAMHQ